MEPGDIKYIVMAPQSEDCEIIEVELVFQLRHVRGWEVRTRHDQYMCAPTSALINTRAEAKLKAIAGLQERMQGLQNAIDAL